MEVLQNKITEEERRTLGVVALADRPEMPAQTLKEHFDALTNKVADKFNQTVEDIQQIGDDYTRWEQDEDARKTAEASRMDAEDVRQRQEAGRVDAENLRVQAENTRDRQEAARETAEHGRVQAEQARVQTEQARTDAETSRMDAEGVRQRQEDARETAERGREAGERRRERWEDYDPAAAYEPGVKTVYNGSSYVCLQACTGIPPYEAAYWRLIAARGKDGEGAGDMRASVYDPNGQARDVFAYADGRLSAHDVDAQAHAGRFAAVNTAIAGVNERVSQETAARTGADTALDSRVRAAETAIDQLESSTAENTRVGELVWSLNGREDDSLLLCDGSIITEEDEPALFRALNYSFGLPGYVSKTIPYSLSSHSGVRYCARFSDTEYLVSTNYGSSFYLFFVDVEQESVQVITGGGNRDEGVVAVPGKFAVFLLQDMSNKTVTVYGVDYNTKKYKEIKVVSPVYAYDLVATDTEVLFGYYESSTAFGSSFAITAYDTIQNASGVVPNTNATGTTASNPFPVTSYAHRYMRHTKYNGKSTVYFMGDVYEVNGARLTAYRIPIHINSSYSNLFDIDGQLVLWQSNSNAGIIVQKNQTSLTSISPFSYTPYKIFRGMNPVTLGPAYKIRDDLFLCGDYNCVAATKRNGKWLRALQNTHTISFNSNAVAFNSRGFPCYFSISSTAFYFYTLAENQTYLPESPLLNYTAQISQDSSTQKISSFTFLEQGVNCLYIRRK